MPDLVRSVPPFTENLQIRRVTVPTRRDDFAKRLALVCRGRENRAAFVELKAVNFGRRVRFTWTDRAAQQTGHLGIVEAFEAQRIVSALYPQLRAWRAACEPATAKPKTKGAAA